MSKNAFFDAMTNQVLVLRNPLPKLPQNIKVINPDFQGHSLS
jgi:hypothetical protein